MRTDLNDQLIRLAVLRKARDFGHTVRIEVNTLIFSFAFT